MPVKLLMIISEHVGLIVLFGRLMNRVDTRVVKGHHGSRPLSLSLVSRHVLRHEIRIYSHDLALLDATQQATTALDSFRLIDFLSECPTTRRG